MKLKEFQARMRSQKIPLSIFLNTSYGKQDPALFYFTQVHTEYGLLVIPARGNATLYVPSFEVTRLKKQSIIPVKALKGTKKQLESLTKSKSVVGVNAKMLSLAEKKLIKGKVKDVSKIIDELRITKTAKEIKLLQKAADEAIAILKAAIKNWKSFKTERDVATFLIQETTRRGLEPSFKPIVASGHGAALPHYEPAHKLRKGFCVIDYGVKYKGYCSDITRTIFLGKPTKHQLNDYALVLHAQQEAIKAVHAGIACSDIHKSTENNLKHRKHFFTHSTGHGLGIEVHEAPSVSHHSKEILKEGMVITIEPGIYPKHFGIRIEDDVVVTKKGAKILTTMPKHLLCIA